MSDLVVLPSPTRGRATMRDVAAIAEVGIKTVSRVMNGVATVDPVLADRVRSAAEQLGYRPDATASNLRRADGRTHTVGLLLEDVGNPFSAMIHRAVENVARKRGVLLLTGSLDEDPTRERDLIKTLVDRRVDGLIVVPAGTDHRYVVAEQNSGASFVFIDRAPEPLIADAVVSDNRLGAANAVRHLHRSGYRRIAYLGDSLGIRTASERFAGYLDGLGEEHVPPDRLVRHDLRTATAARRATRELLRHKLPPDAIFTSQNLITVGAVEALHGMGMNHRVGLVGFDDVPMGGLLRPGISVIAQDAIAIGRLAAERMFARIDGDQSPPQIYTIPTRLIRRGSGEALSRAGRAGPTGVELYPA